MSYNVSWYVEGFVMHSQFWDVVTEQDLEQAAQEIIPMMRSTRRPGYLLIDAEQVTDIPKNFMDIVNHLKTLPSPHELRMAVVLSDNKMINFFAQLASNAVDVTAMYCKNWDEVDELLTHRLGSQVLKYKVVEI